jgi:hypothetical protein
VYRKRDFYAFADVPHLARGKGCDRARIEIG